MEFYRGRHVAKTKKEHGCYDCGMTITAGSEAHKSCALVDGQFLHGYFCYKCVPHKRPQANESTESAQQSDSRTIAINEEE